MRPVNLISLTQALMAAEKGSFNRVALEFGVRQSAVSRRIRSLEDELGVSIFERNGKSIRVTTPGRVFLEEAQKILENLEQAADYARSAGKGVAGEIYLGIEAPLSDGFIQSLLREFRKDHHRVRLNIIEGSKTDILLHLKRREIDFAFIHSRPIGDDPDLANPIFATQNLWAAKLYVAVPKDHPLSSLKIIPLSSLKSENILIGNYGCDATIQDYNEALKTCLSKKLNIDRQMVCRESLKDFVSLGLGVTFTCAPHTFKANKSLVLKPIQGAVQHLQYSGAWLPHNNNPALRKFIGLAKIQSKTQQISKP